MTYASTIGLINNAALLLALCLLYDMLGPTRLQERKTIIQQVVIGIVLGAIGLAIMFTPWHFGHQGVVFVTRSVLLAISGFFFYHGRLPLMFSAKSVCR